MLSSIGLLSFLQHHVAGGQSERAQKPMLFDFTLLILIKSVQTSFFQTSASETSAARPETTASSMFLVTAAYRSGQLLSSNTCLFVLQLETTWRWTSLCSRTSRTWTWMRTTPTLTRWRWAATKTEGSSTTLDCLKLPAERRLPSADVFKDSFNSSHEPRGFTSTPDH